MLQVPKSLLLLVVNVLLTLILCWIYRVRRLTLPVTVHLIDMFYVPLQLILNRALLLLLLKLHLKLLSRVRLWLLQLVQNVPIPNVLTVVALFSMTLSVLLSLEQVRLMPQVFTLQLVVSEKVILALLMLLLQ